MNLSRDHAASFVFPKQHSSVQLIPPRGNLPPANLPPPRWWRRLCLWRNNPLAQQRAKSFSFCAGRDVGGTPAAVEGENGKLGGRKFRPYEGGARLWRLSWLAMVLVCMCLLTVQGLIHWAMSSGVDRNAQGVELAADQIALTFTLEVAALGLVLNSTGPSKISTSGAQAALQGLQQEWTSGQTRLATVSCGLTSAQKSTTRRLLEASSASGDAFSAAIAAFPQNRQLQAVQSASSEYRGSLEAVKSECGAQRSGGENVVLGLTWVLTLLGLLTTVGLVLGALRSLMKGMTSLEARHAVVLRETAIQYADARRTSALQLGYISHELRNPLNGVMGLIHLCLSFVTPAGSRRSSRAVSADHSEEPTPFSGGEFLKGIESPSRDEFVYYGRKRLSSEVDESAMLNKSWPDAWHSRSSASSGSSPLFGPPLNLNRHARLPRLPYMESPPRGGTYSAGGGCEVCHGLVYDNLSLADKSCELMKTIMGDLLDMQRLEAGQVVMAKSSGTLLDVIRHVTRLAETQLLMHAETAETVSRIRSHSRRLTSGDSGFAAVERAMGGEGGGDLGRGPRLSDPPGKKVRGRWEWVQSDGGRVGEGRVNGRAILRYVCDAGVSGTKYEMDRARMEQVVSSLVTNALRGTRPGDACPVLHARTMEGDVGVRLEVVDRGQGLSAAARDTVFQPFLHTYYQEEGLTLGVGLSLYISKLLVTKHMHGSIGFSSEEDFGSTFWVELPFSRVRTPGPSLSFTTASLPGNSPGSNPGTNPSSQPEATTSKTEMPPSGGVPSPVVAAPRSEKEEPSAPFLREPPQLARARKKSPVKVAAHEGQTGGKTPVEVEAQPKAPRRAKEKVTPRAVSQIEVANPRSLSKGASLAGSAAPTTAASRRELFRWSSVLVHAGGTPGAEAEEKFRADFLHSQRSVHPVAEEEGEGESAAATPESARASPKKEAAKEERKLHCLVVDDVHTNRLVLQKILHVLGHTCDTSVNGLEAVVAVTGQKPAVDGAPVPRSDGEESVMTRDYDLILMDVQMPVMDGRRATELIRHWEHQQLTKTRAAAAGPGDPPKGPKHNLLPIIFVTGNVMPGEEALMLSSGATKVIEKPMRMNDLRELIRVYVLDRAAPPHLPPLTPHKVFGWADTLGARVQ